MKPALQAVRTGHVKAMAHITGGGLLENIPRVLPDGVGVWITATSWQAPPVFNWLATAGKIDAHEMARTFNCGIGLVVVVAPEHADEITAVFEKAGEKCFRIGAVEDNKTAERVHLLGASGVWPA